MHILLEKNDPHTVQSYTENSISVNSIEYKSSLILSETEIIAEIPLQNIQAMDEDYSALLIKHNPKIIILGHTKPGSFPPEEIIAMLSQKGIGVECMGIGAACRTYNVLLSEGREVVLGVIFD